MFRTIGLKLVLEEGQKASLLRTIEAYTLAFDDTVRWGWRNRVSNK
jgi:predicted transposase